MPKPVCVPCALFYRPKKNGYFWIEGAPLGKDGEEWRPYKLWQADLWECKGCGHQLVVGAGYQPIAVSHQKDFKEQLKTYQCTLQVNDC